MKIKEVEFIKSGTRNIHLPEDGLPEFMFAGRSNVGKSSFINALLGRKSIARVSQRPGKTQTLNVFRLNGEIYLIDLPGYGYAAVSKTLKEEFGKMIEEYVINRKELKKAFLLVDFRHAPSKDDILMYDFLKYYHIPTVIIATKQDKVKRSLHSKQIKLLKSTLELDENDSFIVTSSEKKVGMDLVLDEIEKSLKTK